MGTHREGSRTSQSEQKVKQTDRWGFYGKLIGRTEKGVMNDFQVTVEIRRWHLSSWRSRSRVLIDQLGVRMGGL